MPKVITTVTVTIPAGESVSSSADLTAGVVAMIYIPQDWTPANISFLASHNGSDFFNVVDEDGIEVLKPTVAGAATLVDPSLTSSALHMRIRAGSSASPVIQETDSLFVLVLA